jgi:hypothetical protein
MPWAQLLDLLKRGGPQLLRQLPKLWPMLLEPKTRRMLIDVASDVASQSPAKRLRGRIDGTCAVAEGFLVEAEDPDEKQVAEGWVKRARNLRRQLDVPVQGRSARRVRRGAVADQLGQLQEEMQRRLGQPVQNGD